MLFQEHLNVFPENKSYRYYARSAFWLVKSCLSHQTGDTGDVETDVSGPIFTAVASP